MKTRKTIVVIILSFVFISIPFLLMTGIEPDCDTTYTTFESVRIAITEIMFMGVWALGSLVLAHWLVYGHKMGKNEE